MVWLNSDCPVCDGTLDYQPPERETRTSPEVPAMVYCRKCDYYTYDDVAEYVTHDNDV